MKTLADGLFFHPKGGTPDHILGRLVDGEANVRLDYPFAPAIDQTQQEIKKLDQQIQNAEARVRLLKGTKDRAEARLEQQHVAEERYAETGEIDDVLLRSCDQLAKSKEAKQNAKIKGELDFTLPDELKDGGWHKQSVRVNEREIIVTLRKTRTDNPPDVQVEAKKLVKKVKDAMRPFQTDDAHYRRVLRERIASRPQQPKGPPDG